MLDVHKLATLVAVVEHGSLSAAAAAMGLTQPAVSRQVSLLERRVGSQLVVRSRRGVHATAAGDLLVEHARVILRRVSLAERHLADLRAHERGPVTVGWFFTALAYLSVEVCAWLDTHHPDITIRDELVDRADAFLGLEDGRLDVAVVFEHGFDPQPGPVELHVTALFEDPPRVLLPADHRQAQQHRVCLRQLRDDTWVRPHDGSAARLLDHTLDRLGIDPPQVAAGRGDEPVEAQALVAAGSAVMLAFDLNVIIDPHRIAVRAIEEPLPTRTVQVATATGPRRAAVGFVLDALDAVARHARRPPSTPAPSVRSV